jgi:hypothetical protein
VAIRDVLPLIVPTAEELVAARLSEARTANFYLDRAAGARPFDFAARSGSNDLEDAARRDMSRRLLAAVVVKTYGVIARQPEFAAEILRQTLAELLPGQDALRDEVVDTTEAVRAVKDDIMALRAMLEELLARSVPAPAPLAERAAAEVLTSATED